MDREGPQESSCQSPQMPLLGPARARQAPPQGSHRPRHQTVAQVERPAVVPPLTPLHCPHRSTPTSPRGWPRERAPSSPPRSRPLVARLTRQSRRSPPPPPSCRCTVRRPSGSTGFLLSLTRTAGPCGSRVPRPGRKLQECRGEVGEVQPSEAEPGGAHCGLAGRLASHWRSRTAASPLRWLSAAQPCPEQSREGHDVALTDGPEGSREGLNEGRAAPARPRPGNRCAGDRKSVV